MKEIYELLNDMYKLLSTDTKLRKYFNNIFLLKAENNALPYLLISFNSANFEFTYSFDIVKMQIKFIIFYKFYDFETLLSLLERVKNLLSSNFKNITVKKIDQSKESIAIIINVEVKNNEIKYH